MADDATNDGSGSEARVALDLMKFLRNIEDEASRKKFLDQYAECLEATRGMRRR